MKIRIIKVCAPFINFDMLGKVSDFNIIDDKIYLNRFNLFISPHLIKYVNDNSKDIKYDYLEKYVYVPEVISN